MTIRPIISGLAAALLLGVSSPALAAIQQGGGSQLNYEGADLAAFARDVAFRTNRAFVIDPRLSGRVNIISPPGLTLSEDEVWEVFLATLQVNGYAAVPIGEREYRIVPSGQAIRDGSNANQPAGGGSTVTRVVRLRNVAAATAAANLRGIAGETGLVTPITESNSLIIVDNASNMARLLSVVDSIDVDDSIVRTVQIKNAAANQVAATLQSMLSRNNAAGQPAGVSVVAVDANNTVLLRGDAASVNRLLPVIEQLDTATLSDVTLDTIYLNHADAEEIVPIIQQLLNERPTAQGGEGAAPRPATAMGSSVAFHKGTNALIVNGSPETQRMVRSIVNRLDIRRPQVLIEAVVVSVSDNTARELGVQYVSGGGDIPLSAASFGATSPNVISAAGAALFLADNQAGETQTTTQVIDGVVVTTEETVYDQNDPSIAIAGQLVEAAVSELLSFDGFLIGAGGDDGKGGVYGVLLSAIQSDSQSNILQVPSTVLLDNEEGLLSVGQEIPIITGEAIGSDFQGGFRQIERKDVGTILKVTPQINAGNSVRLEISLEISSLAFSTIGAGPVTNESLIETVALAEDGQTLVIGGLVDSNRRDAESKVPLLGDIPIMGNLFKGQNRQEEKSTLMVFIRPTILRDGLDSDSVTARKYDYVRQQQLRKSKDGRARIDDVMETYLGHMDGYSPRPQGDEDAPQNEGEAAGRAPK
ncbi:type II secretion system secretin GspD [Parvularcula marina]|uniref:type II secretion system secretin GspD n=1 Tax=Parvularcula marina TaxID=2292771 RepID=UPI003515E80F